MSSVRHTKREEEKARRLAAKAEAEENKRLKDLKGYKTIMKVG